jgi:hypothetical protein
MSWLAVRSRTVKRIVERVLFRGALDSVPEFYLRLRMMTRTAIITTAGGPIIAIGTQSGGGGGGVVVSVGVGVVVVVVVWISTDGFYDLPMDSILEVVRCTIQFYH